MPKKPVTQSRVLPIETTMSRASAQVSMDNEDLSFAIDHLELKQEEGGDDGDFICKFTAHTWELCPVACSTTDDDEDFIDGTDINSEVSMESDDHPDENYDTEMECGACSPTDDDEVVDGTHVTHEVSMESADHHDANHDTELECGELYSVACSPTDSTLVATGGCDNRGFLWKIGQVDKPFELQGHKDSVASLAFSYDGQLLASGCLDGIVKVWDLKENLEGKKLEGPGPKKGIEWLRWHPRGHILLAGSQDFNVWMWNSDNSSLLNTFIGHGGSVTCGDFTPDGKRICTGSEDATMRIWNPKSGESIHVVRGYPFHTEGLTCLAISSTSTLALTGSMDGSVHIVNISTGRVVDNNALASHSDSVECVGFAPSDSWAAVGGNDKKLIIWDIEHLLPRSICEHEGGVSCLAWLGAYVATGCVDGKVRLWDSRSGECVKTFKGHSDHITALSVSADGSHLVSASHDETACVFEVGNFL